MVEPIDHEAFIDAWLDRVGDDRAASSWIDLLERALGALYSSAVRTLGVVTLNAICDRVLYEAVRQDPALSSLRIEALRVITTELRTRAELADPQRARTALRFVLLEHLTVLGNLTAEILTPSLHHELTRLADDVTASRESKGDSHEP